MKIIIKAKGLPLKPGEDGAADIAWPPNTRTRKKKMINELMFSMACQTRMQRRDHNLLYDVIVTQVVPRGQLLPEFCP